MHQMTLVLKQIAHGELCLGWIWTIENEEILAEQVARIALGQYRHLSRILEGLTPKVASTTAEHVSDALKKLTVSEGDDPWHRDGWIFQSISWIAAHKKKESAFLRGPHIRKADHGFDGLQLQLSDDGTSVTAVIIFEDKATTNARKVIREEVWPSITGLELGERVTELTSDVSAMLEACRKLAPEVDVADAATEILWKEVRHYRVSITVGDTHSTDERRKGLFKGFDTQAPGPIAKRRAETIYIPAMREWMESFAIRVMDKVKALANV